jgi:hypothetical protein
MIKKQLGLLAGSVMVAATSNAAITLGSDTLAVFNTAGAGSYYQLVTGSTASSLVAGTGFSIDIATATAALGGTVDQFALFALDATGAGTFNYDEAIYVSAGGGLVFAGSSAVDTTNLAANNTINSIQGFLANADLGLNGEGSFGDFDSDANVAGFLNSGLSSLIFNEQQGGGFLTDAQEIGAPVGVAGATFASAVPVPAAAWLFGSALLGLGVVRRKK